MKLVVRTVTLCRAAIVVRRMRERGVTWEKIHKSKRANPLKLTPRSLYRLYGPNGELNDRPSASLARSR